MTNEGIDNLTGDALNAAVAKALGWTGKELDVMYDNIWSPATSISDAFTLLDGINEFEIQVLGEEFIIAEQFQSACSYEAYGRRTDAPAIISRFFLKVKARRA